MLKLYFTPIGELEKSNDIRSSFSCHAGTDEIQDMKIVVRHRDQ
uniref:Uncharacterized protein n=1 Tax=Nelumbo nucifera TaxID=4432 RepID=A0A822ZYJ2_NELNU|nr:TPA_asm: hypothetical protein HUJ06_018528 [Nelumbo nucifera]